MAAMAIGSTSTASAAAQEEGKANPALSAPPTPEATYEASALSAKLGISESQAARDLSVEDATGGLTSEIEQQLGSTYADVWFDPWHGRFEIGVAPSTEPQLGKIRTLIAERGLNGVTDFVPVHSTYNELVASQNGWTMRVGSLMQAQQAQTMIDPSANAVVVKVSDGAPASELRALSQATYADTVNVKVFKVPATQLAVHASAEWACRFAAETSDYCTKPFIGGTEIWVASGSECTAGFIAQSILPQQYPDHYLLTAGHCLRGSSGIWASADNLLHAHALGSGDFGTRTTRVMRHLSTSSLNGTSGGTGLNGRGSRRSIRLVHIGGREAVNSTT